MPGSCLLFTGTREERVWLGLGFKGVSESYSGRTAVRRVLTAFSCWKDKQGAVYQGKVQPGEATQELL